jgi:hypothetical protein
MTPWPEAVTLNGRFARLEPLAHGHHDDLVSAVRDGARTIGASSRRR